MRNCISFIDNCQEICVLSFTFAFFFRTELTIVVLEIFLSGVFWINSSEGCFSKSLRVQKLPALGHIFRPLLVVSLNGVGLVRINAVADFNVPGLNNRMAPHHVLRVGHHLKQNK